MAPSRRRSRLLPLVLLCAVMALRSGHVRGGENSETTANGGANLIDLRWDRRFYDGTAGWAGFVKWYHNPSGIPGAITATNFQNAVQAGFDAWNAIDNAFGISPLIPIVTFQGTTSATGAGAVDGVNAIVWFGGAPGGVLATTLCTSLTSPSATTTQGGQTVLPIGGGMTIPFPGPAGITYPAGTLIDCGIQFDNQDPWTTAGAVAGAVDVQSIATHEAGHFLSLAHSTVGETTASLADDATMIPFASPNNIDFRSLHNDDISSAVRTYSRVNGLSQTTGGRGRIIGTLKKNAGCGTAATGVSVRAYLSSQGLEGANSVETFSGSQFRQGLAGEPSNGSFELNVLPGGPYTLLAHTFENGGGGFYDKGRFDLTANNSNTVDAPSSSQALDNLATVASISAGQTVDLGTVGILGCVPDLIVISLSGPSSGTIGGQIAMSVSVMNQGMARAGASRLGFYFSTNSNITTGDTFSGSFCNLSILAAGASTGCSGNIDVPGSLSSGVYYLGAIADDLGQVAEGSNENNNARVADSGPITLSGPSQRAIITSPANSSTLPGSSVTFQWTSGGGVDRYWLAVSQVSADGYELYGADQGPSTARTVNGLPTNGATIYVRLYSHIGSNWVPRDFTYTAAGPAIITSPANGSTLPGTSVTFQWTSGSGVDRYWLAVSQVNADGYELYGADQGPVTSKTVNGLPTDGATIYVRLYSHIGSNWVPRDFTYTAAGPAIITSPADGTALPGSSVTFQWTSGIGVDRYWLAVSQVSADGYELYGADQGLSTARTVIGLPTNGATIYVRLYSHIGSNWISRDFTYMAAGPAIITSPANGSTLPGSSVTFQWTSGIGVDRYWLAVSNVSVGGYELYGADQGPSTARTVNALPANGAPIYVRLYSHLGSNWVPRDFTYTAAGP